MDKMDVDKEFNGNWVIPLQIKFKALVYDH